MTFPSCWTITWPENTDGSAVRCEHRTLGAPDETIPAGTVQLTSIRVWYSNDLGHVVPWPIGSVWKLGPVNG